MICKKCNHDNPEGNRFCGSCGASLQLQLQPNEPQQRADGRSRDYYPPPEDASDGETSTLASPEIGTAKNAPVSPTPPTPERNRKLWTPPPAGDAQRIERLPDPPAATPIPAPPRVISKPEESIAPARTERAAARPSSLGGHSFLGLGIEDDPQPEDEKEIEYRGRNDDDSDGNDDLYRTNWSGRILVGLVIVAIVGVLGWMQWQSQDGLKASPGNSNQAASPNSASNVTPPPASPSTRELEKEQQTKNAATAENNTASQDAAGSSKAAGTPTARPGTAGASPDQKTTSDPAKPPMENAAQPDMPAKSAAASEAGKSSSPGQAVGGNSQESPTATSDSNSKLARSTDASAVPAVAAPKPAAASNEKRLSNPDQNSEEPVRLAEIYLTGKGVPQNCDEALGILRTASNRGNARALIKLGALYATGNCVAMDRVAAYRYFTLASKNEPNNTWLEQSRSMLWANMNDSERKQAMEVER